MLASPGVVELVIVWLKLPLLSVVVGGIGCWGTSGLSEVKAIGSPLTGAPLPSTSVPEIVVVVEPSAGMRLEVRVKPCMAALAGMANANRKNSAATNGTKRLPPRKNTRSIHR